MEASVASIANVRSRPGFRRSIRIEPQVEGVRVLLEDDFHAMAVTLLLEGEHVAAVEPDVRRAPSDTCPGAGAKLVETFAGRTLAEVNARRDKKLNCTHLHDLAVLGAAHARDNRSTLFELFATDPDEGVRVLELHRDGACILRWVERDGFLTEPASAAGLTLLGLRDWIARLPEGEREAARMLQWGSLVAHGRLIPMDQQSEARALPASCYTLQPERAAVARRIGLKRDFSTSSDGPLAIFEDERQRH